MRNDIVRMYRDIHSWVGIICGLALFIAFYAGAVSMFEVSIQRWASPPVNSELMTPLDKAPKLIEKVLAKYPEAGKKFQIVLVTGPEHPARLKWKTRPTGSDNHDPATTHYANLNSKGALHVVTEGPSEVAQIIDNLHQRIGLPFEHEIADPIMGVIALLYSIALVSGVLVLIPTLVKSLFTFRLGKNVKRMWLDLHNLLGIFSLPFHIIMSLTAVVFAFHEQFYDAQNGLIHSDAKPPAMVQMKKPTPVEIDTAVLLAPDEIIKRLKEQAPDYQTQFIDYRIGRDGKLGVRVAGVNPAYGSTWPRFGSVEVDASTGEILGTEHMPGRQGNWNVTISTFFSLHFGNFGGSFVQWCYLFLGLGGAFLFYTGNLLWIEVRRKRGRNANKGEVIKQTKSSRVLGALTVGISLGCVAGISLTIAAAKFLPLWVEDMASWHKIIYYSVFVAAIAWSFKRGAAKAAVEMLLCAALFTLMIPLASLLSFLITDFSWNHYDYTSMIDLVAVIGAIVLFLLSLKTANRIKHAPIDSVWYAGELDK